MKILIRNLFAISCICSVLIFIFTNKINAANPLYGIRNYYRQYEFIKIDVDTDGIYVLNLLPNFFYTPNFSSSYNYLQQKYYLCSGQKMQVLDCISGDLDTTYDFTSINPNYFIHTIFNPVDSLVYGIKFNISTYGQIFSKFDPANGSLTEISPIVPEISVGVGCKSAIDPYLGEYYLQSKSITTIRISDGHILSDHMMQSPGGEKIDHLAYSCDKRKLFALSNNYSISENYFSEIDEASGATYHVDNLPLSTYFYKQYLSGSAIDNSSGIFYYSTANGMLYGIDINNGSVVYSHDYGPYYQFLFVESSSNFDCTVLEVKEAIGRNLEVYPNPGNGIFSLILDNKKAEKYNLEITDAEGRMIIKKEIVMEERIILNLTAYTKGFYFFRLMNQRAFFSGKIILE